ncbi:MAG: hypothetical protein OEZ19_02600 [Paracoccaceae bacterium]|nr:hypothetical protein [Paracoccaceae bacterium]
MSKLIAILNVIAWSGFWAFGYIALTSDPSESRQMGVAALMAFLGAGMGVFAYLWLVRHSEMTGYAKPVRRATPNNENTEGTA